MSAPGLRILQEHFLLAFSEQADVQFSVHRRHKREVGSGKDLDDKRHLRTV